MNFILRREIDTTNHIEILYELNRLRNERSKYNIHNIPKPNHVKRADFSAALDYTKAKDSYYETYKKQYKALDDEIKTMSNINTKLCIEQKTNQPNIVNKQQQHLSNHETSEEEHNDEEEQTYLEAKQKYQTERRKRNNKKYYKAHEKDLKNKAIIRQIKNVDNLKHDENNKFVKHLFKTGKIIKPVCVCGKRCDVIDLKNIKTHSNLVKHKLMKSIIGLVKYKRQFCRIKPVIKKINRDLKEYKKVVRIIKPNDKSGTMTNKTETETYCLFNDMIGEVDENNYIYREPYINKLEYTKKYQDNIFLMRQTYQTN